MTNALLGLKILNTRPKRQAQALNAFVTSHGGQTLDCPAIEITPLKKDWGKTLPDHADMLIFISQNAVTHSINILKKKYTSLPEIAAIGRKTRDALNKNQLSVAITARNANTESLLEDPSLHHVKDKTIVVLKGCGGRDLLIDSLSKRGAKVIPVDVYQRDCPKSLPDACKNIWKNSDRFIILGTSIESVENIFTLFGQEAKTWLQNADWLVLSPRIKQQIQALGVKNIYLSKPDALYPTLLALKTLKDKP